MADKQEEPKLPALEAVEEDDEFEEFAAESWADDKAAGAREDLLEFAKDWEADDAETDFAKKLAAELAKHAGTPAPAAAK